MCKRNVLTIVALAILALASGLAQAETIPVPNGEFMIYKPGTNYTVTATFPPGGNSYAKGVGDNLTVIGDAIANYSDGTSGAVVDCPGWKVLTGNDDLFGNGMDGSVGFNAFGTWSGGTGTTAGSAASLGDIAGGRTYTLSAMVNGSAGPLVFDLLAGGVALTPSSSVTPSLPTSGWQEISRTYDAAAVGNYLGQPMTIVLGTGDKNLVGTRVVFDNVSLSYEVLFLASNPIPANEATDVPRDVVLSWIPGIFAAPTKGHKVYFGERFNDVNNAAGGVAQDANSYTPALDFGKTYYWRVDEVNAPPTSHIEFKGEVWSFTTEQYAYPIENITATASSSDVGMGPANTINGSGLDANDLHSTASIAMWLSSSTGPQPTWIQYEFDKAYKLHEMWVWNYNAQFENIIGFGLKDVTVQYSTDSLDWKVLSDVRFARGPGAAGYAHDTIVDFGGIVAKYVKITAKSNWGGQAQYGLSEVRFFYIPVWAREPNPDSGATGVGVDNVTVSWRAGREAASHKVYFSTSRKAVIDETISPVSIPANGSYASYNVGSLDLGRTYYWKVNEVNDAEIPTTWKGDIWNFRTAEYLVVDDFESYGDGTEPGPPPPPGNRMWYTWKDGGGWTTPAPGWGGNGTGSVIDLGTSITHDGSRQALTLNYDNDGTNMLGQAGKKFYSEITADLANLGISSDWTRNGVKALTLYFYGDPNNNATAAEQMYVKVNGVKRVYDGDMADIRTATWHEWNIDLSLVGTNLQNVTQISIGFGNENATTAGGSGTIFIDDIRLYPARCRADVRQPGADLNDDCVVDYLDLQIIANQWLTAGHLITPVDPGTAGLEAQYKFEGNTNDSSGKGRNGTAIGGPLFVAGKVGQAISLDGIDDYVNIDGYKGILADAAGVQQPFTLCAWIKATTDGEIITWGTNSGGQRMTFRVDTVIRVEHGSGNIRGTNGPDLRDDQWHHVAATIPQGARMMDVRLYVDGSDVTPGSTTTAAFNLKANVDVRIGMGGPTGGRFLTGLVDDARIYDRVLSPEEIVWLAGITAPFSKPFDLNVDGAVNFKDFAVLADSWLEELLWP
jgi:hypothetical protein